MYKKVVHQLVEKSLLQSRTAIVFQYFDLRPCLLRRPSRSLGSCVQKGLGEPGWWANVCKCFEADPELTTKMLRSESGAVRPPDWAVTPLAAAEPPTDDRPTLAAAVGSAVRAVHAEVLRQRYDRGGDLCEFFVDGGAAKAGGKPRIGSPARPSYTETGPTRCVPDGYRQRKLWRAA